MFESDKQCLFEGEVVTLQKVELMREVRNCLKISVLVEIQLAYLGDLLVPALAIVANTVEQDVLQTAKAPQMLLQLQEIVFLPLLG